MPDALLTGFNRAFDAVDAWWESAPVRRATGTCLVLVFVGALAAIEASRLGLLPDAVAAQIGTSHFAAIGVAFTALLIVEVVALVLALARSVATSVGVQFQLFSLILLREAFKELGALGEPIVWETAQAPVQRALADGAGVGGCDDRLSARAGLAQRWQEHTDEQCDDRDHHKELNEGESAFKCIFHTNI